MQLVVFNSKQVLFESEDPSQYMTHITQRPYKEEECGARTADSIVVAAMLPQRALKRVVPTPRPWCRY